MKYSSLEHIDRTRPIFFTYKNEIVLGPAHQLEERFIEIGFIFTKGEMVYVLPYFTWFTLLKWNIFPHKTSTTLYEIFKR